jgi:hypothetical protein
MNSRTFSFPEELNGLGCYGTIILRVLAGSGYTLYWSSILAVRKSWNYSVDRQQSSEICHHCDNDDGNNAQAFITFIEMLNR